MVKNSLYRPVDHFLQTEIISKLAASEKPVRFTDLKTDGIENSLFMYHANKLIDRGLVQKDEGGFSLTTKGARWANYVDSSLDLTPLTPRTLIQFVIEDTAQNVLLAVRKGSLKKHLNDYLLPGNVYRYGWPLADKESTPAHTLCTNLAPGFWMQALIPTSTVLHLQDKVLVLQNMIRATTR